MSNFFRNTAFGQIVHNLSGGLYFKSPEEDINFKVPDKYSVNYDNEQDQDKSATATISSSDNFDYILLDWYENDPEHPYRWSNFEKSFFIFEICFMTACIYMGSSIYTPGIDQMMAELNISRTVAILPLSSFVLGYGLGPMILSPLSEHPAIGRTTIYVISIAIFGLIQIPTALSSNIVIIVILRFIAGFVASPTLATGGASVGDVVTPQQLQAGLAVWAIGSCAGPVLGPILGGILSAKLGWRWTIWILAIAGAANVVLIFFFLPETSHRSLLYRKSKRLKQLPQTNPFLHSPGELEIANRTLKETLIETLWRPIAIGFGEPVVLFLNIYTGIIYSLYYMWFEAFPIVFIGIYKFSTMTYGLSFLGIFIGCIVADVAYIYYTRWRDEQFEKTGKVKYPEYYLPISIFGGILLPISILMFSWTSTASIHWMVPQMATAIYIAGSFVLFQSVFNYLGTSFPRYMASVFAGHCLFRSVITAAFPLFTYQMYEALGPEKFPVGWGGTILGGISTLMIAIPVVLYKNGPKLRAKSKYAN